MDPTCSKWLRAILHLEGEGLCHSVHITCKEERVLSELRSRNQLGMQRTNPNCCFRLLLRSWKRESHQDKAPGHTWRPRSGCRSSHMTWSSSSHRVHKSLSTETRVSTRPAPCLCKGEQNTYSVPQNPPEQLYFAFLWSLRSATGRTYSKNYNEPKKGNLNEFYVIISGTDYNY